MRKGYKWRKGLVALLSAFVLVFALSIPMFAVDSSAVDSSGNYTQTVTVNGTYYFADGSTVLDYFSSGQSYEIISGTIKGYVGTSLSSDQFVKFAVTSGSTSLVLSTATVSGSPNLGIAETSDTTSANPEFDAVSNRYLVFENVVIVYQGEIYEFLLGTKTNTSTLVFTTSAAGSPIVEVIVDAFNGVITGLGSGVADFFQTLFIAHDGTGNLSVFAIVSLVFIGVAVAFGIARWIIKKVGQ